MLSSSVNSSPSVSPAPVDRSVHKIKSLQSAVSSLQSQSNNNSPGLKNKPVSKFKASYIIIYKFLCKLASKKIFVYNYFHLKHSVTEIVKMIISLKGR